MPRDDAFDDGGASARDASKPKPVWIALAENESLGAAVLGDRRASEWSAAETDTRRALAAIADWAICEGRTHRREFFFLRDMGVALAVALGPNADYSLPEVLRMGRLRQSAPNGLAFEPRPESQVSESYCGFAVELAPGVTPVRRDRDIAAAESLCHAAWRATETHGALVAAVAVVCPGGELWDPAPWLEAQYRARTNVRPWTGWWPDTSLARWFAANRAERRSQRLEKKRRETRIARATRPAKRRLGAANAAGRPGARHRSALAMR